MNKKHLAALATAVLLAISGVVAGGAQAAPFDPALPLSPASQQNAVQKAKDYLDYTAFSRQGLIKHWNTTISQPKTQHSRSTASPLTGMSRRRRKQRTTSATPPSRMTDSSTNSSMTGSPQRRRSMG